MSAGFDVFLMLLAIIIAVVIGGTLYYYNRDSYSAITFTMIIAVVIAFCLPFSNRGYKLLLLFIAIVLFWSIGYLLYSCVTTRGCTKEHSC